MSIDSKILDGTGTKSTAKVTHLGQLVTSPLEYSTSYFNAMTVDDQVYNFTTPKTGQQFVITDIVASGDKNVTQSTGVEINIYESDAADGTSTKDLLVLSLNRLGSSNLIGLNMILTESVWLNATMDDNNVNLTILGYYVDTAT